MTTDQDFGATLTAQDLTIARGGRVVLENVRFSVASGDAVILRGPNGSGKTSLLRTLAGLLSPVSGSVECSREDATVYCGVQNGAKAALTVNENLKFWAGAYGAPLGPARAILGLEPYENRLARELSTGFQRRLGLARLIIARRPVWLIDEPTSGLDTASRIAFDRILAEHRAGGGSALIATHEPLEAPDAKFLEFEC